jgi:hypothetical protein
MGTDVASTTELPGGYLLVDHGPLLDLRAPTPDASVPYGGLLAAFAVRQDADGIWLVRTRGIGLAYLVADRAAAIADLTRYAGELAAEAS